MPTEGGSGEPIPEMDARDDKRRRHRRDLVMLAQSVHILISKLVKRGERNDDADWSTRWENAVKAHWDTRFNTYRNKEKNYEPHQIRQTREHWARVLGIYTETGDNVGKYLLRPPREGEQIDGGALRESFKGLNFNQVDSISEALVKAFGFGTDKQLSELDIDQDRTWSTVIDHALARLTSELSQPVPGVIGFTEMDPRREENDDAWLPASNVETRTPACFTGRETALDDIEAALRRDEDRVSIVALHGLRGVGKTVVAATYAHEHRGEYRATWWIEAETDESIRADLISLGRRLRWVRVEEPDDSAITTVRENLADSADDYLLVFDNAAEPKAILPYIPLAGRCRIIITSNWDAWRKETTQIEIETWSAETGADFLILRTKPPHDRSEAKAVSTELGGLPLALEQAAAYCEGEDVWFAEYRRRFAEKKLQLLDDRKYAPEEYGLTVASTFGLAIEAAAKLHPAAEPLISHAALLASEPIPLFLFADVRGAFSEPLNSAIVAGELDQIVARLRAFALVTRQRITDDVDPSLVTDSIRLHPLIREVAAARLSGERFDETRRALFVAIAQTFPIDGDHNPKSWPRRDSLRPHLLGLWCSAPETLASADEWASLFDRAGSYYRGRDGHDAAEILFRYRALTLMKGAFGREHPAVAKSFSNLATALRDKGELASAFQLIHHTPQIFELDGPDYFELTTILKALRNLLRRQREFTETLPLLERALATCEKAFGANNPLAARCAMSAADLFQEMNDHLTAMKLYRGALAILENAEGPDGPGVAMCLNRIGHLLLTDKGAAAALPLFERSLRITEHRYGPAGSILLPHLCSVGEAFLRLGRFSDARDALNRALVIFKRVFGRGQAARTFRNSLVLRWWLRDPGWRAISFYALSVYEEVLGAHHPETKRLRRNRLRYAARWYIRKSALLALIIAVFAASSWLIWRVAT